MGNFFAQGFNRLNNMTTSKKTTLMIGLSQSTRTAFRFRLHGQPDPGHLLHALYLYNEK